MRLWLRQRRLASRLWWRLPLQRLKTKKIIGRHSEKVRSPIGLSMHNVTAKNVQASVMAENAAQTALETESAVAIRALEMSNAVGTPALAIMNAVAMPTGIAAAVRIVGIAQAAGGVVKIKALETESVVATQAPEITNVVGTPALAITNAVVMPTGMAAAIKEMLITALMSGVQIIKVITGAPTIDAETVALTAVVTIDALTAVLTAVVITRALIIVQTAAATIGELTTALIVVATTDGPTTVAATEDIIAAAPTAIRRVITAGVSIATDTDRGAGMGISVRSTIFFTMDPAMIRWGGSL